MLDRRSLVLGLLAGTAITSARAAGPGGSGRVLNRTTYTSVRKTANQTLSAAFSRVTMDTVDEDTGGNWSAANNWYTCPRSGIYQITGSIRAADSTTAGNSFSLGVYTSEADGPWHFWTGATGAQRNTFAYSRLSYQNAGDQLRMFSFSTTNTVIQAAGLQIVLVSEG